MIIIVLTSVAFILSIILVFADSKLNKEKLEDKIEKFLPGFNCGGCGYGSCHGMACEILKNKESYKKCRPLKDPLKLEEFLNKEGI